MVSPLTRDPTVRVSALNHAFGIEQNRKRVLHDNNLDLMPGEIVIMTGPSGSGKTTLLTLIGALRSVQEGSIFAFGRELRDLSPPQLVKMRREIGFIFQAHNLFDSLTARENVNMAVELTVRDPRERDPRRAAGLRPQAEHARLPRGAARLPGAGAHPTTAQTRGRPDRR